MSTTTQDAPVEIVTQSPERAAPPHRGVIPFLSREQILEATVSCFAESGYDGTTIRAIAARLGCSVGSIYRYFHDKRDLLLACGERAMRPVTAGLESPGVTFEESLRTYLGAASVAGELYRLQFWLAPGVPAFVSGAIDAWAAMLGDAGEAQRRWAVAHGLMMLGRADEEIVERSVDHPAAPLGPDIVDGWEREVEDMTLL